MDHLSLFTDGGVVGRNPSSAGGTWAYVGVGLYNEVVLEDSGFVEAPYLGLLTVSNNVTELLAAVLGLEAIVEGWAGVWYTDSLNTLRRVMNKGAKMNGVPTLLVARVQAVRERLGSFTAVLLGGHPTVDELAAGKRRDGYPVSPWNVRCDRLCGEQAARLQRKMAAAPAP